MTFDAPGMPGTGARLFNRLPARATIALQRANAVHKYAPEAVPHRTRSCSGEFLPPRDRGRRGLLSIHRRQTLALQVVPYPVAGSCGVFRQRQGRQTKTACDSLS